MPQTVWLVSARRLADGGLLMARSGRAREQFKPQLLPLNRHDPAPSAACQTFRLTLRSVQEGLGITYAANTNRRS